MQTIQLHHLIHPILLLTVLLSGSGQALPQNQPTKATIVIVGDADRLNVGQDGFCGDRTEINSPSKAQFRIPAGVRTHFFIKSSFQGTVSTSYCQGDFSFIPESGKLHIIRHSMINNMCKLELYKSDPGGTPVPMEVRSEESVSCLLK